MVAGPPGRDRCGSGRYDYDGQVPGWTTVDD